MTETNTLKLGIDASGAKQGADQFAAAVQRIGTAIQNMDKQSGQAFDALKARLTGLDFSKVASDVSKLGTIRVDANLAKNLTLLASSLKGFTGINASTASALSAYAKAFSAFRQPTINAGAILSLANAMRGFRAPSALQTQNFDNFIRSLNSTTVTANVTQITHALGQVTAAAHAARSALAGIGTAQVNIPRGLRGPFGSNIGGSPAVGGGGGGNRNRGYGPRSGANPGPYDGIFSGQHRATGELRGFENAVNPSFQAASIVRAMIPALTAGSTMKGLYSEGAELTNFQHTLESITNTSENLIANQTRLSDAMLFATTIAEKYGLDLDILRTQWARFSVTATSAGFGMKDTKETFENLSAGARARGLDPQQIRSLFNAVDQAMSTGHFTMMQMHKEMGLFLPVIELMSRALNKKPQEIEQMSSKGQIGSGAALPFSREMLKMFQPGLATALDSPQSGLARLRTEWTKTLDMMNENGVWDAMGKQFNRLAAMLRQDDIQDMFRRLALGIADALRMMGDAAHWAANNMDTLIPIFKGFVMLGAAEAVLRVAGAFSGLLGVIGSVGSAAGAIAGAGAALALPFLGVAAAVAGVGVALYMGKDDLASYQTKSVTVGDIIKTRWIEMVDDMKSALSSLATFFESVFDGFISVSSRVMGLVRKDGETTAQLMLRMDAQRTANMRNEAQDKDTTTFGRAMDVARKVFPQLRVTESIVGGAIPRDPANQHHTWTADEVMQEQIDKTNKRLATERAAKDAEEGKKRLALKNKEIGDSETALYSVPLWDNKPTPKAIVDGNKKGKTDAEKAQDQLDNMLKALSPSMALPEKYAEELKTLETAKSMGVHSKAAEDRKKADKSYDINSEYGQIDKGIKDKFLEGIGALTPYDRALKQLKTTEEQYQFAVDKGLMSEQQRTAALARTKEAMRATLDPQRDMLTKLQEENRDLKLNSREREIATTMRELENKSRADGAQWNAQVAEALRQELVLRQKLRQEAENRNTGISAWANSFQDLYTEIAKVEQKIAGDLTSAFTKFVMTGKLSFKELGDSILADLTKAVTNEMFRDALKDLGVLKSDKNSPTGVGAADGKSLIGSLFGMSQKDSSNEGFDGGVTTFTASVDTFSAAVDAFAGGGGNGDLPLPPDYVSPGDAVSNYGTDAFNDPSFGSQASDASSGGLFGGILSAFKGGGIGGLIGKAMKGIGSLFGGGSGDGMWANESFGAAGAGGGGLFGGLSSMLAGIFQEGGISGYSVASHAVPATSFANVPHYAEGTGNTSGGIPAMLHPDEAVIPLSRGRKVPIDMGNARGGNTIHVSMNVSTPDADSFRASESQIHTSLGRLVNRSMQKNG